MHRVYEVPESPQSAASEEVSIVAPTVDDGADVWRIARDSNSLDLNSSYAYVLHCHDYATTCRVASVDGRPAGFVLGYRPPERANSIFIWQIAVDDEFRGRGMAGALLDSVVGPLARSGEVSLLETTIADDNIASRRVFASFAKRWAGGAMTRSPLFEPTHFPDEHDAEPLYRIGPFIPD